MHTLSDLLQYSADDLLEFKNFGQKLKKITDMSLGWNKILKGIDFSKIRERKDLELLPITRKSSFPDIQKNSFPYGNLNIKPYQEFKYMFASPGPIYEPGDNNDFWNMSRSLYSARMSKANNPL